MQHSTPDTRFQSHILNRHFGTTPPLNALPDPQARLVRAFRFTVLFGKAGKCPIAHIMPMVGGLAAAAHFVKVVQILGAHWPEPICLYRPCCPQSSTDEMLLLDMINCMVLCDLTGFHALLSDMISDASIAAIQTEVAEFTARHIRLRHRV